MKYLLTLGDSWPAGAELVDKSLAFPELVANTLGVASVNLSQESTSADQALYQLINVTRSDFDWSQTMVLFCLTGITRSMHIDRVPREIHPMSDKPASVAYYKYIHSDRLDQFNRIKIILAAQQYCRDLGSRILFVDNWDRSPKHIAIDHALFYNKTLTEILNIDQKLDDLKLDWYKVSQHPYIYPNQCHPNVDGHSLIAKEISVWIKEKLNDKSVS